MQMNIRFGRAFKLAAISALAAGLLMPLAATAQTLDPLKGMQAPAKPPESSSVLTRSSYPVSKAQPKQFTVEYVYRYEEMDYTPEVVFAPVERRNAVDDTPEHLFAALISSMKALDYDWWFSLWDAKTQEQLKDAEKTKGQNAAYWRGLWQNALEGQTVTLVKRLQMPHDTILQFRLGQKNTQGPDALIPAVMRYDSGHWKLTAELNDDQFLFNFLYGVPKVSMQANWVQTEKFSGEKLWQQDAQAQFFKLQPKGADSATEIVW